MKLIFALLIAFSFPAYSSNIFTDGFENMSDTGWLDPTAVTYNRAMHPPEVISDLTKLAALNDENFQRIGSEFGTGSDALIPPYVGGTEGDIRLRLTVDFAALSLPSDAVVTGMSMRIAAAAEASGTVATADQMQFIFERISILDAYGQVAAGEVVRYGIDPGSIDDGRDFVVTEFGGQYDTWGGGEFGLPSDPDFYNYDFNIVVVMRNNGPYSLSSWYDLLQIKVHYFVPGNSSFEGSGTTDATVLRGIPLSANMAGAATIDMAANNPSATKQITTGQMVGSGDVGVWVINNISGVSYVYAFPALAGSGVIADPVPLRVIGAVGDFEGSGTTDANPLRGRPFAAPGLDEDGRSRILSFGGTGVIAASARRVQRLLGTFGGAGVVDAITNRVQMIGAALGGTGVIAASAEATRQVFASLLGTGTVNAQALRARGQVVGLVGTGLVEGATQRGILLSAGLVGSGVVDAEPSSGSRDDAPDDRTFDAPAWGALFDAAYGFNVFLGGTNSMSVIGALNKQPVEVKDFDIRFDGFFNDLKDLTGVDDFIISATAVVSEGNTGAAGDLMLGPGTLPEVDIISGTRVKVWVGAGVSGVRYKVTVVVTTADGRVEEEDVYIRVKEQ